MHYLLILALFLLVSCQEGQQLTEQNSTSADYDKAFKRSIRPNAKMIYKELEPIRQDNANLMWDEEGRVLMVGLTSWNAYNDQAGNRIVMGNYFWVVPAHSLRQYVKEQRSKGQYARNRLLQKMGKAATPETFWVLEVWVDPADLFRPCPDAAIEDKECQLKFPADATAAHKEWFKQQDEKVEENQLLWSRLGYTYDWGQPDAPVGFSEYVVQRRVEMKLMRVRALSDYGKAD